MPDDAEPPPPTALLPPADAAAVEALAARLGVALGDAPLALAALTHKSYVNEHRAEGLSDNERLEFLGDAVIDLAVSHRLMERFPAAREGELSKMRAAVVDEPGLARLARQLELGPLLRLGRGEERTGGREKSSLLADALEAVIAVVYLEGGLERVLSLVDRWLGDAFARAAAGTLDRDYKTQLQELAQSRHRAAPRYRVVAEHGPDHSKTFDVELEVRGEIVGRGSGRSKKDAEQAAAQVALEHLSAPAPPPPVSSQPATPEPEPTPPEPAAEPPRAAAAPEPTRPEAPSSRTPAPRRRRVAKPPGKAGAKPPAKKRAAARAKPKKPAPRRARKR
jgi:ribonuclease-3